MHTMYGETQGEDIPNAYNHHNKDGGKQRWSSVAEEEARLKEAFANFDLMNELDGKRKQRDRPQ